MSTTFTSASRQLNETNPYSFLQTTDVSDGYYVSPNSTDLYQNTTFNSSDMTTEAPAAAGDKYTDYIEYNIAVIINNYYLYVIIGIGIPGNLAAIITLSKMRPLSSSLLYMVVLAVVDSLSLIIKLIYLRITGDDTRLYNAGCKLMFFFGTFTMHYSNWILVAMTVERFIAIWFPLRVSKWCTKRKAVVVMVITAIFLIALNLQFFWSSTEIDHNVLTYDCAYHPDYADFMTNVWYWIDGAAYSFLPFLILFVCNLMIVFGIKRSNKTQRVLTNKADKGLSADKIKQQNQITIMLVTVSVVFIILTMPNCIFFIVKGDWNFTESKHEYSKYTLWMQVVFFLSDFNHAVNFYLYFLSGKKFRQKFKAIIFCRNTRRARQNTTISNLHSVYNKRSSVSYGYSNSGYNHSQSTINDATPSPNHTNMTSTTETSLSVNGSAGKNGQALNVSQKVDNGYI